MMRVTAKVALIYFIVYSLYMRWADIRSAYSPSYQSITPVSVQL